MWAHCFVMDWPGRASPQAKVQQQSPALPGSGLARWVTVTCPVRGLNIAKCTGIRPGEVRASVLCCAEANPGWDGGQDRRFVGTFRPPWFSSLPGIVLHYFSFVLVSLPAYVAPTPASLPRALFNFKFHLLRTVCLSRFLFSFLVYLFFLFN